MEIEDPIYLLKQMLYEIHQSVFNLNAALKKQGQIYTFISPKDFMAMISHLKSLRQELFQKIEEQQFHIKKGLIILKNTEKELRELDASLLTYQKSLGENMELATQKMNLIQQESSQAEEKKSELVILQEQIKSKKEEIEARKEIIQRDLDQAGPALESAKSAVLGLDKKQLESIKTLKNPPAKIKMTLEGVAFILTQKKQQWADIVKLMVQAGFIKSILDIRVDLIRLEVINQIKKEYLEQKDWDVSSISSAFGPAGVLAQWLESQIAYSFILKRVEPLTNEIKALQDEFDSLQGQQSSNERMLEEIAQNLVRYKEEFAQLTMKNNQLKGDIQKVNEKVVRSKTLLANLS